MKPEFVEQLILLIRQVVNENSLTFVADNLDAKLHYAPDHGIAHIILAYHDSKLGAHRCADLTDQLIIKVVDADLDMYGVFATFTCTAKR